MRSALPDVVVWFVNATVSIMKLQSGEESLDLLWLSGCKIFTAEEPEDGASQVDAESSLPPPYQPPPPLRCFQCEDPALGLPAHGGPSMDCIYLSRIFLVALRDSKSFTMEAIHRVRLFAKQRHVYGS